MPRPLPLGAAAAAHVAVRGAYGALADGEAERRTRRPARES